MTQCKRTGLERCDIDLQCSSCCGSGDVGRDDANCPRCPDRLEANRLEDQERTHLSTTIFDALGNEGTLDGVYS